MSGRKQLRGPCAFCGREMTRIGFIRHLKFCPQRREAIEEAANKRRTGQPQQLFHLLVQDARNSDYWLHLEMNSRASLEEVDYYLRAIWLDCCGHPSHFSVKGGSDEPIPIFWRLDRILERGVVLIHHYDPETPSETLVKLVGIRTGQPLRALPVGLMARNGMPAAVCAECGQPAGWYCAGCLGGDGGRLTLCQTHASEFPHQAHGQPVRLLNSPRMGLCAYDGPAEPPY